jgi:DNA polymerase III subunit epsilon
MATRQIVIDTETTGLSFGQGHRIVEIGAVELANCHPTGRTYQQYINPERSVPLETQKIHGLSGSFLSSYPPFDKIADDFLDFCGTDYVFVAHNAPFDRGFVEGEVARTGIRWEGAEWECTLQLARKVLPSLRKHSLDAICAYFNVDITERLRYHGALIDAKVLALVYPKLLDSGENLFTKSGKDDKVESEAQIPCPLRGMALSSRLTLDEMVEHLRFVETLKNPLWNRYNGKHAK